MSETMAVGDLLGSLFEGIDPIDGSRMRGFLQAALPTPSDVPDPFARLVHVAMRADRRTAASAAGHQAAISRLFPDTPSGHITAFCVSEEGGARPTAIQATLREKSTDTFTLTGEKKWGTMSPDADTLYIAASTGTKTVEGRALNQIRMVGIPADREGIHRTPKLHNGVESELRIADLSLRDVEVRADEIFPGDGFRQYVKPFRLIEDVFGIAATQVGVFCLGRRWGWRAETLEDLLGVITQAWAIARTDMASPTAVLTMAAYFRRSQDVWDGLHDDWANVPAEERARWAPEVGLLGVAQRARDIGRERAWDAMGSGSDAD